MGMNGMNDKNLISFVSDKENENNVFTKNDKGNCFFGRAPTEDCASSIVTNNNDEDDDNHDDHQRNQKEKKKMELVKAENADELTKTKPQQFRVVKALNLLLLLTVLALISVEGALSTWESALGWSKCWSWLAQEGIYRPSQEGAIFRLENVDFSLGLHLALAIFSLVLMVKSTNGTISKRHSLLDICLAISSICSLLIVWATYTLRTFVEFTWFWPKLRNESITLEELVEWRKRDSEKWDYWDEYDTNRTTTQYTPTVKDIGKMESRKQLIQARLVFDPAMVALTVLAILLQAVFLWRIVSAMKQTKQWSNNYAKARPSCSRLDTAYACFWPLGLLKLAQMIMALAQFNIALCADLRYLETQIDAGIIAMACMGIWICYVEKVRFTDRKHQKSLLNFCKKDCQLSALAIPVLCVLTFCMLRWLFDRMRISEMLLLKWFPILALFFTFFCSFLYNLRLLRAHGHWKGVKKIWPGIAVNIQFVLLKDKDEEEEEEAKDDAEEKREENDEEKKEVI